MKQKDGEADGRKTAIMCRQRGKNKTSYHTPLSQHYINVAIWFGRDLRKPSLLVLLSSSLINRHSTQAPAAAEYYRLYNRPSLITVLTGEDINKIKTQN